MITWRHIRCLLGLLAVIVMTAAPLVRAAHHAMAAKSASLASVAYELPFDVPICHGGGQIDAATDTGGGQSKRSSQATGDCPACRMHAAALEAPAAPSCGAPLYRRVAVSTLPEIDAPVTFVLSGSLGSRGPPV